jgi:uncharacterized membrane protein YkoI
MLLRSLVLLLVLACAAPAGAARCLSDAEARKAIAQGGLITPAQVMRIARARGGDIVSSRLCEGDGGLIYRLAVIDPDGRVMRLVVDAQSGAIISGQ